MIPEIDGSRKILWGLTVADLSHVGVHGAVPLIGLLLGFSPEAWAYAAAVSVVYVEGVDIVRVRGIGKKELRDLIFRSLGGASGWVVAALLNLII